MTKRALIVIFILILIPIIVVATAISKFKSNNVVVAKYGGSIDVIEYDGMTLHRVAGEEDYNFRFGKYLGKVGSALTGASLYLVADDDSGDYYAIADGAARILYTKNGKLPDGVRKEDSKITRIVFDDYLIEEIDPDNIAVFENMAGKKVSVDMSQYKQFKYYDLYLSFDGSAILTEYLGRLIFLIERESWIFLTPEALAEAEEEYGKEIADAEYIAELISDVELKDLLDSYFEDKPQETMQSSET